MDEPDEFFVLDGLEPWDMGSNTAFPIPATPYIPNRQVLVESENIGNSTGNATATATATTTVSAIDIINFNQPPDYMNLLNRNFDLNGNGISCLEEIPFNGSSNKLAGQPDEKNLFTSNASALNDSTSVRKEKEGKRPEESENEDGDPDGGERHPFGLPTHKTRHADHQGAESIGLWHSGPSHLSDPSTNGFFHHYQDLAGAFTSSLTLNDESSNDFSQSARTYSHQQLGVKVEMVCNLLSMLGTNNREDMSKTLLAMSSSAESCHAMRQGGCIPLLVQLIHSVELDEEVKSRASRALHNIVYAQNDDKCRRREIRVLKLLEQIRTYCDTLRRKPSKEIDVKESDEHPVAAIGALMKFSFDAEHRQAICVLGGLQAISELMQVDHEVHGCYGHSDDCLTLRRYAGMSLTNLTFGDGKNKALLCGSPGFINALVDQLRSSSEDLRQVTASVLRNLSWRADSESKDVLRGAGAITSLTVAAMEAKKEATLKSVLSALWNLSAHCSMNKVDICSVPGALAFLVKTLRYKSTSNTLSIVENAGGIIRNISSHIAVREDYRQILRDNNCFEILLEQLRSSSLTIVSNACGTLWNLSARCVEDQKKLWEMGATSMLRNLVQSKHKMISMGSSAALKNLLSANPNGSLMAHLDTTAKSLGYHHLPTLTVRKQRALEQEIDVNLAETCDDIEAIGSPNQVVKSQNSADSSKNFTCARSDSRESIRSSKSDSVYERLNQRILKQESKSVVAKDSVVMHESLNEKQTAQKVQDQKFIKRYKSSMIPTPVVTKHDNFTKAGLVVGTKAEDSRPEKDKFKRGIPILKARIKTSTGSDGCSGKEESFKVEHSSQWNDSSDHSKLQTLSWKPADSKENSSSDRNVRQSLTERSIPMGPHACSPIGIDEAKISRNKLETEESAERAYQSREIGSDGMPSKNKNHLRVKGYNGLQKASTDLDLLKDEDFDGAGRVHDAAYESLNSEGGLRGDEESGELFGVLPNFKIGFEMSDPKSFPSEAGKICQAIRKYQEVDVNSQMSMVSCSSFLDTTEYSLFEVTHEITDIDDWESNVKNKPGVCASTKTNMSLVNDHVSLPSLGSSKVEPIDAFDLESSIISVASIVSEVAENNLHGQDSECTSTLTYKTCEGTINIDDEYCYKKKDSCLFEESNDCLDDDNSLVSQENLPWDPETVENTPPTEPKKKTTAKERRKLVSDRYRTYTIKDFRDTRLHNAFDLDPLPRDAPEGPGPSAMKPCYDGTTALANSKSLNDLLKVGPSERKELVDNAKLVALSLRTAVFEDDSDLSLALDSEGECSRRSVDIDTATYSKDRRQGLVPAWCDDRYEDVRGDGILVRAIISKTVEEKVEKPDEGSPTKGVRGRRKPLYSSPFRNIGGNSTPASPKTNQKPINTKNYKLTATKSLPNVPKSVLSLEREGTFTKNQTNLSWRTSEPRFRCLDPKLSAPERITLRNKPTSFPATKLTKALKTTGEVGKSTRPASGPFRKHVDRPSTLIHSLDDHPPTTSNPKERSTSSRKEVESKIARLWKMAEEAKEKNKHARDKRVWIGPDKKGSRPGEA